MSPLEFRHGRACMHAAALASIALLGCTLPVDEFSAAPPDDAAIALEELDAHLYFQTPPPAAHVKDAGTHDARRDTRASDDDEHDDDAGHGKGKGRDK